VKEEANNMRKLTRLEKSTAILSNSKASQWCYVNTDNEFTFMGSVFVIDKSVEEYKVVNKAGETEDFTNEAYMEEVLAVLGQDGIVRFYNQNYDHIEDSNVMAKQFY
jgi:hypothetical protein